ncbi:MAG: HTH domain-containing protein, partial [Clostridia bacterium]
MQINRLFEMVYILLDKKKVTAGELARRFEVSPRTIYRDAELLSSAGIPVYM